MVALTRVFLLPFLTGEKKTRNGWSKHKVHSKEAKSCAASEEVGERGLVLFVGCVTTTFHPPLPSPHTPGHISVANVGQKTRNIFGGIDQEIQRPITRISRRSAGFERGSGDATSSKAKDIRHYKRPGRRWTNIESLEKPHSVEVS